MAGILNEPERAHMEGYHYTECGLDNVWLLNGVRRETFGKYGPAIAVDDENTLWNVIGRTIANQDSRMVGQELKFLRTLLDWTQTTLGKHMGYKDAQMVAKWEKARHTPIPVQVDTFVRAAYREKIGEQPKVTQVSTRLQEIVTTKFVTKHVRLLEEDPMGQWVPRDVPKAMELSD
jgi:putative transcriptional regulator